MFNGIVIYGTHARKIKTTSFDAFESANIEAAAKVVNGVVVYSGEFSKEKHRYIEYNKYSENDKSDNDSNDTGLYADTDMCEDIMVLKLFPGIKTDIFDYIKEHYRGVIIESFGIGGIPCTAGDEENDSNSSVAEKMGELTEAGIAVVITTQCMYEGVSLDVYEVGHILARQNVIVAKDMTTEAVTITTQYWEMIPSEFINPTPAGRKNNPMFSVRSVESFFTLFGLTTLNASARNNSTIPITLPGINPSIK